MLLIAFLVLFPLFVAALLLIARNNKLRCVVVSIGALLIAAASIALVVEYFGTSEWTTFPYSSYMTDYICAGVGIVASLIVLIFGARYKNQWACLLACIQIAASCVFEFVVAPNIEVESGVYIDSLSLIMALIIGIVGSGICVYALGYMKDFQDHEPDGARDRRPVFFALMFLFLSAMYVIIFANNMAWMFTGWEVTTVCSFLLIAYTRTEEAIKNAFRQIIMNMAGGLAFLAALFIMAIQFETLSFVEFLNQGIQNPDLVVLPVCALSFAGITKAAQMPFQSWLLGAMVAPTPTSALLHSSTMVKAGVFLLVKLAPIFYMGTQTASSHIISIVPAMMVILVGGLTFMLCSFMAISQSNAKRVLAYSTVANLGLICACAGIGSAAAVWAAVFLIIFHAVAKSLLFLCVGTAEHHIGSRDIEDMDLLFERMPRLARFMMLGIMIMFIAPFGMLIAKWATLVSVIQAGNIALLILLAFGSAATFMFWAKWLGKLAGIANTQKNIEANVHKSEWFALLLMAILSGVCCAILPLISGYMVEPYIESIYNTGGQAIASSNLWIACIASVLIIVVLFAGVGRKQKGKQAQVYLSGVSANNAERAFINSLSGHSVATSKNLYLPSLFGEKEIRPVGVALCTLIIVAGFAASLATLPALL